MKRLTAVLAGALAVALFSVHVSAANSAYLNRFDQAWRLVKDFYYDLNYRGVDWDEVGERYHGLVAAASSWREVYELLDEMYSELGDDHSRVLSPPEARRALRGGLCYPLPFPVPPEDLTEEEKEWQQEAASEVGSNDEDFGWGAFEYGLKGICDCLT